MDNFEKRSEGQLYEKESQNSDSPDCIFQFILDDKESSTLSHKPEKNEYKIQVETNLKEPVCFCLIYFQTSVIGDG